MDVRKPPQFAPELRISEQSAKISNDVCVFRRGQNPSLTGIAAWQTNRKRPLRLSTPSPMKSEKRWRSFGAARTRF